MNIPREEAIIITPHQGAKRTAIHVFKPRLAVEGKEPYREPNEPFASTLTIWQKRGRYKQAAVSPPSAKVKAGEEKFLAAHESGGAAQNRAPSHKPTRAERNAHLQPQPKKQAKRKQDIDPEAK